MIQKIKFGIVGLGHIGSRHAQCILHNDAAELTTMFDVLPVNQWRIDHVINKSASFEELIKMDIDVVSICTPNYLHATMAIDALRAGKHVVIEKPMAISTKNAQKIIDTATNFNKLVFCVMQNRFSATMIWLKEIISKGLLGKINMVSVNCFWNRNENYYLDSDWHGSKSKDGGPLFTQFSHFVDILYWLFGDVKNVTAEFFSFNKRDYIEFEDSGIIKVDFTNDIVGVLNYSTAVWNKNFESSITIIGEHGSVKIGGQYMDKIIYCDIRDYVLPKMNIDIKCNDYGSYQGSASNHDKMIDNVVSVLLDKKDIHTNSIDGLNVVKIIEEIYSYRN
jgi:predicted dehydrogenase